jgi:endonuclease/exonuclease/phosphatase family metal-dependent hydrolase
MTTALRILQLNAGTLLEPDWEHRRHEVLAWFERLDPDVVCLQEIWEDGANPNTAGWLVDASPPGRWHWVFGGHHLPEELWPDRSMRFGPAILSRWPFQRHEARLLPGHEGPDPIRRAPWAVLHGRTAGLDVFSVHLAAAPQWGDQRREQAVVLDAHVRDLCASTEEGSAVGGRRGGMPPIVAGDFNAEPDSDEIRFLCGLTVLEGRTTFYQDAFRVAGEGPGYTQDWRTDPIAADLNVHRKRIDYILVGDAFRREGSAGRVLSARVVLDEPLTGVVASDHFGVFAEVEWPGRPV